MKKHLLSLFDPIHRKRTLLLFLVSAALIIASQVTGTVDHLPGILLLMAGMVCLFYTVVHPWKTPKPYATLIGVCIGLIILTFGCIYLLAALKLERFISEGLVMGLIGLFCLPGIVAGIGGVIYFAYQQRSPA